MLQTSFANLVPLHWNNALRVVHCCAASLRITSEVEFNILPRGEVDGKAGDRRPKLVQAQSDWNHSRLLCREQDPVGTYVPVSGPQVLYGLCLYVTKCRVRALSDTSP